MEQSIDKKIDFKNKYSIFYNRNKKINNLYQLFYINY